MGNKGQEEQLYNSERSQRKFNSNPTVRLINVAKNELGHISKVILDTTNKNIRDAMGLNQWRNADTVIDWFKSIRNKTLAQVRRIWH